MCKAHDHSSVSHSTWADHSAVSHSMCAKPMTYQLSYAALVQSPWPINCPTQHMTLLQPIKTQKLIKWCSFRFSNIESNWLASKPQNLHSLHPCVSQDQHKQAPVTHPHDCSHAKGGTASFNAPPKAVICVCKTLWFPQQHWHHGTTWHGSWWRVTCEPNIWTKLNLFIVIQNLQILEICAGYLKSN